MKKWLDSSSSSEEDTAPSKNQQHHYHPLAALKGGGKSSHVDAMKRRDSGDDDDNEAQQITPLQVSRQAARFSGRRLSQSPARNSGKLSPRAAGLATALPPAQATKPQQPSATSSTASAAAPQSPSAGTNTTKVSIGMEFGDEYVGEAITVSDGGKDQLVPHGRGTLQSPFGKHCYVGDFEHRLRDGYGKLVTERFVLWARWKANRPDLATSARVDYPNGDKYSGYLDMSQDQQAANILLKQSPQTLSNFSIWVRTATITRERWGEAVLTSSGSRYFGQWEKNLPQGFGCYFGPTGDRYIGMFAAGKFCGSGTLFTSLSSSTSTTSGVSAVELGLPPSNASIASSPSVPPMQAGGTVYDGVWEAGLFAGEDGHIIFPCHTRVTADWVNACHGLRGQVVFSHVPVSSDRPKLIATFQWEPLLLSSKDGLAKMDPSSTSNMRAAIMGAKGRAALEEIIKKVLKSTALVVNACKIFRRCFFFLYGTCGNATEIGSGGATPTTTGWCHARHAYGGCIHPGKGKRIDVSDTVAALGDIHSFIGTVKRWLYDAAGSNCVDRIVGELDAENVVSRAVLDLVMQDVHAPLLNLYSQAYAREEVQLSYAVRRLRQTTLDDFGVSFGRNESEKLFDPYADAVRSVEKLPLATSLSLKLSVLSKWSKDIDLSTKLSQVKLQEEHLLKISSFVRERSGTALQQQRKSGVHGDSFGTNDSFASQPLLPERSHTEQFVDHDFPTGSERFRGVPAEAVVVGNASNSMRYLSTPPSSIASPGLQSDHALEAALQKIPDESPEKLMLPAPHSAAEKEEGGALSQPPSISTKNLLQHVLQVESGSADDLLPIHQYVLCKSSVPTLFANTKLLVDLSSDDSFVDPTSQDCFCITTLQACVSIIPELFVDVRDPQNVITSVSMYDKRVEDFVSGIRDRLTFQQVVQVVPLLLDALSVFSISTFVERSSTTTQGSSLAAADPPASPQHQFAEIRLSDLLTPDDVATLSTALRGGKAPKVWSGLRGTLHCVLIELLHLNGATGACEDPVSPGLQAYDVGAIVLRVPVRMHSSVFRSAAVLIDSFRL